MPRSKILIVEGDLEFAMLEMNALARGFETEVVRSLDAARRVKLDEYDAVVLGYNLPDGSGIEFLRAMGDDARIPVVVVTAEEGIEPAVQALKAGAVNWLTRKPDNLAMLPVALEQAIGEHHAHLESEHRRLAVEESLRESERRYRLVVDNVSDVILQLDPRGVVTFATPSAKQILGYDEGELIGRHFTFMLMRASAERAMGVLEERLRAGATPPYYPIVLELDFVRKDGAACACEVHAVFVRDERGVPQGIVAVISDISERRVVADALHRNEDEIEALALEIAQLRSEVRQRYMLDSIVGGDPAMQAIFQTVVEVGRTCATVLVQGETGTGKELVAKAIHYNSARRDLPFVKVDCGALAETLLESELFGHVKGAFTGAISDRRGRFELAAGGTIFLDEIHNLSTGLQAKLLRVVQDGTFEKVGGVDTHKVDVRIVAATNEDLRRLVDEKKFRMDLFYRLNVIPILLPPLRDRSSDIPMLVSSFVKKLAERHGKSVRAVSDEAIEKLRAYRWPGNVRELENIVEQAVVFCTSEVIGSDEIRLPLTALPIGSGPGASGASRTLREALSAPEQHLIADALKHTGGNRKRAAEVLGISRSALYEKLRRFGIVERK